MIVVVVVVAAARGGGGGGGEEVSMIGLGELRHEHRLVGRSATETGAGHVVHHHQRVAATRHNRRRRRRFRKFLARRCSRGDGGGCGVRFIASSVSLAGFLSARSSKQGD